jgi:hypothetical protein
MKHLNDPSYPKLLAAIVPITNPLIKTLNVRRALCQQLAAYPVPSHVVAHLYSLLPLTSLDELKQGLLELRNVCKFTSLILTVIPTLRSNRYQLSYTDVTEYVTARSKEYGYTFSKPEHYSLVAYLITAATDENSAWTLDMSPSTDTNRVAQASALYESVLAAKSSLGIKIVSKKINTAVNGSNQTYYSPTKDALVPLSELILPNLEATSQWSALKTAKDDEFDALSGQLSDSFANEALVYNFSDIKLIDTILSMLNDRSFWQMLLPPRAYAEGDAASAIDRATGLSKLAALCQSLLLYPHIFRYELFKQTYEQIGSWQPGLPSLPSELMVNYELFVRKFDVLNAHIDVKSLLKQQSDEVHGSVVHLYYKEAIYLMDAQSVIAKLEALSLANKSLQFEQLSDLKDPRYDTLLLTFPLGEVDLAMSLSNLLFASGKFISLSELTFAVLNQGYALFYEDKILDGLKAISFRNALPIEGHPPITAAFDASSLPTAMFGSYDLVYNAPNASAVRDYNMRNGELMTIFTASSKLSSDKPKFIIDRHMAAKHRKTFDRDWRTFYTANYFPGDDMKTPDTMFASALGIRSIFERISGQVYSLIARSFGSFVYVKVWATYLSSFALIYKKDDVLKGAFNPVEGYGSPYGTTYEALSIIQNFTNKVEKGGKLIEKGDEVYDIPDTDYCFLVLKKIPVPSTEIQVGNMYVAHPYYYYKAGESISTLSTLKSGVKSNSTSVQAGLYLVLDEGLLHMNFIPFSANTHIPQLLLDKKYAYLNDSLIINTNARAAYRVNGRPDSKTEISLKKVEWKGDKTIPTLEMVSFGSIHGSSESFTTTDAEAQAAAIIDTAAKEIDRMERDSPVAKPLSNSEASVNIPTVTGLNPEEPKSAGGPGKSRNKKKGNKNAPKPFHGSEKKEDEEGEDELTSK